jgi:hypothetical protein
MDMMQRITDFLVTLLMCGIVLFVIVFVVNFIKGFSRAKQEYEAAKATENLVEVHVETMMQGDNEVFFLYEAPHSNFIFQANSTEEVAKKLFEKYKNKTIRLRQGNEEVIARTFIGQ